ncbi:MAG: ornithine cyclodeaminase family protein [Candidatus Eremiobacteraeota bacterium]|nr:ornithine cyclodeaminase family protein [Candidatus Eremiobacteraeota bacterium]
MEEALAQFSRGEILQPVRSILPVEEGRRYVGIMPAAASDYVGVKVVSAYPGNAGTSIPTHSAAILLLRADTGEPVATVAGTTITEMRTAAVSAAVTKHLMPQRTRILALLGSGVQAHAHVEALQRIVEFEEIRVWSPNSEHAERFAREHGATATDAESAVRDADVIVVATHATEPVLKGAWLKTGAHVNALGAIRPHHRELDDDVMLATVVVDSREAARLESGDIILSKAKITAEIGEIFAGTAAVPRAHTTVFKSLGLAVEDLAAARLVLSKTRT